MTKRVIADSLHIRAEPSTTSRVLADLARGTDVQVLTPGAWLFVRAPDGSTGWVHGGYLVDTPAQPAPKVPAGVLPVPHGEVEVRRSFGEPGSALCQAGRVLLHKPLPASWDAGQKVTRFSCHKLIEKQLQAVFDEIHAEGLDGLLTDYGGCFALRKKRGLASYSVHSWGIALDLNANDNPLGAEHGKMDPRIVAIFKRHGFVWGGDFSGRKDWMHFQYASGV